MYKKYLSIILVIAFLGASFLPYPLTANANNAELQKVSDDLLDIVGISYENLCSGNFEDSDEFYSCILWMNDIDMTIPVKAGIDAAEKTRPFYTEDMVYEYPYSVMEVNGSTFIDVDLDANESDLYVQTYIENEREKASELYVQNNAKILKELIHQEDIVINYVSSYSPCIFAELTIHGITKLLQMDEILSIGYWGVESVMDQSGSTSSTIPTEDLHDILDIIDISDAKTKYGVSGDGVKIGQLESGCPTDTSVTVPSGTDRDAMATVHANNVYTIMHTVAPDAAYYAIGTIDYTGAVYEIFPARVEWLLSQGVNIINVSAHYTNNSVDNIYNSVARWVDHITYNHDAHFVTVSGNYSIDDDGNIIDGVLGAGMGYNVITVGNTLMDCPYPLHETSLYNDAGASRNPARTYKPDLCAPGTYSGTQYGTSYSAPLVTGAVALICDYQPALKTKQHIVKAILAATTGKYTRKHVTEDEEFKQYGAGIIDVDSALWVISQGRYITSSGTVSTSSPTKTYSMEVLSSDSVMRIALSYGNRVRYSISDHTLYSGLYGNIGEVVLIIKKGNTLVTSCTINGANLKVVEFSVEDYGTGTYTIEVKQIVSAYGATTSSENATIFGLAWR